AWSRTGLPLMARGVNQKPIDLKVQARFLIEEVIDHLRSERQRTDGSPKLDFEKDLLPLLVREMADAYHASLNLDRDVVVQVQACGSGNPPTGARLRRWKKFRWEQLVSPISRKAVQRADTFRSYFLSYLRRDIAEALQGNLSCPVKSAC